MPREDLPLLLAIRLADSPSEMAAQMRAIVRERLEAGETPEQVREYFVARYGEWILLAPRRVAIFNGVNPMGQELTVGRLRAAYARSGATVETGVRDRDEQPFVPILERFLSSRRQ